MNLSEIAARDQEVRGRLKARREQRAINAKEADKLDADIGADLAEITRLEGLAAQAFALSRASGLPEPAADPPEPDAETAPAEPASAPFFEPPPLGEPMRSVAFSANGM